MEFGYICRTCDFNPDSMKVVKVKIDGEHVRARRKIEYVRDGQKVCGATFVALPKGGRTYSRRSDMHHFVFCLKGRVRIDTRHYWDEVMQEGQMAFVPGGWHLYLKALDECEVLIFSCASLYFGNDDELLDYIVRNRERKVNFLEMNEDMDMLVRNITSMTATKRLVIGDICEAWRVQLMITLESYYSKEDLAAFLCRAFECNVDFRTLVTNAYEDAGRSIERLAMLCGMSKGTLYNRFKAEFGMTPNDWMIEKTKKDMIQAARTTEITPAGLRYLMKMTTSQLCGFTRRHLGCTPQELIDRER